MFVIFLDLDGVLVTQRCTKSWVQIALPYGATTYRNICFDEEAVSNFKNFLNKLSELTEYKIVLSSDWRWNNPEDSTRAIFDQYQIPQYVDITLIKEPETHGIRGKEIKFWLDKNKWSNLYLAIDDIDCKRHIPKQNFVYVTNGWHSRGFNEWHVKHAIQKAKTLLGK